MSWYDFIDMRTPLVFSPKVTPDPSASERLEEKLMLAMRKLDQAPQQNRVRKPVLIPAGRLPIPKAKI